MKLCKCRKGAIAFDCERHANPACYLTPPRSRSLWERLWRWLWA